MRDALLCSDPAAVVSFPCELPSDRLITLIPGSLLPFQGLSVLFKMFMFVYVLTGVSLCIFSVYRNSTYITYFCNKAVCHLPFFSFAFGGFSYLCSIIV